MPPRLRPREGQEEVSLHTENFRAESATNVQGQNQPPSPPVNPNGEAPPKNLMLELI